MKKTSKIFGAAMLSAALAVGTAMPAFADPVEEEGTGFDTKTVTGDPTAITKNNKGDAKTDINLRTETDVINCTLPLKMTVVAKVAGGDILCPTPGTYKIVNNNEDSALYVTGVTAALAEGWGAASTAPGSPAVAGSDAKTYGHVNMQLTPGKNGSDNAFTPLKKPATTEGGAEQDWDVVLVGTNKVLDASNSESKVNWTIAKKVASSTDNELGLKLEGSTTKIAGIETSKTQGEKLLTVTYTVSAMPTNAATTLAN